MEEKKRTKIIRGILEEEVSKLRLLDRKRKEKKDRIRRGEKKRPEG